MVVSQGETMTPRKKASRHSLLRAPRKNASSRPFYTPFQELTQRLKESQPLDSLQPPDETTISAAAVESFPTEDDAAMFREAVADVVPVDQSHGRVPLIKQYRRPTQVLSDDDEVRAHLSALIGGAVGFEISCSDEYIDGAVIGLSPKILAKLRRGEFSCQAYVDLHGRNRVEAERTVIDFLRTCFARDQRCVLIVSGRGRNSENREPVLKEELIHWFTRSPLNRWVLAFSTARPRDGGTGAFYVLLRRSSGKAPLISPTGW
jgi:DNA-nicking Smr family endonuclease